MCDGRTVCVVYVCSLCIMHVIACGFCVPVFHVNTTCVKYVLYVMLCMYCVLCRPCIAVHTVLLCMCSVCFGCALHVPGVFLCAMRHAALDMCVATRTMCPMNAMNPCVLSLCSVREGYVNQMYMGMHASQGLCVLYVV